MSAPIVRPAAESPSVRERRRVREHLRRAERSARRSSTTHLDPLRRRVRALLLDELAAYRARGLFPRNGTAPGFNPVFVDEVGTRCAVAHLLAASGETALVDDIASRRNLAYVDDLADEARLVAWLEAAGLSLAEAAAIQPAYQYTPSECVCGREFFGPAPPYATPATAVLDVRTVATFEGGRDTPVDGVVAAIDGRASGYAVGQSVRVLIGNFNVVVPSGSTVLVPVGGVGDTQRFSVPDGGDGQGQDGGAPLLGGYVVQQGAINCSGAIGPLDRSTFTRAVESPRCTAVLASVDDRWVQHRMVGGEQGCSCAVPVGAPAATGTLGILLGLLAFRRRRLAQRGPRCP